MPRLLRPARFVVGLALLAGLAGCDHTTDPDGPNLIDRFGPFAIVEPLAADRATADFAAGEAVVFSARFNKQTAWVLEITGQTSGAVHRIEGVSNALDATNARWTGRTTDLPFFRAEPVEAALFFPSEAGSDTLRTSLAVATPRAYPGAVVAAFEGGETIRVGNFEFEFQGAGPSSEVPAAQGNTFYLLRGTDSVVPNFFVGLIDILPPANTYTVVPTTVPSELFVNAFLYSFGTPNTIAVVQVVADANGNRRFDDGTDTVFVFLDQPVDWTGWRAINRSLGDMGMTETQVQQIVAVRVLLISDRNNQPTPPLPVDYGIDYVTFTAGGPLEP